MENHLIVALAAPPSLAIPPFFEALGGWLIGILLLVLPSAWLAYRSHSVLGHWSRYLAQWHRAAWWVELGGAGALAFGAFALLGVIPTWQNRWNAWYAATSANTSGNLDPLTWLNDTQAHLAQLLRLGAGMLMIGGIIVLAIGIWQFQKNVLTRRTPVAPTSEWMMSPRP
jgi:hypothetical protein